MLSEICRHLTQAKGKSDLNTSKKLFCRSIFLSRKLLFIYNQRLRGKLGANSRERIEEKVKNALLTTLLNCDPIFFRDTFASSLMGLGVNFSIQSEGKFECSSFVSIAMSHDKPYGRGN